MGCGDGGKRGVHPVTARRQGYEVRKFADLFGRQTSTVNRQAVLEGADVIVSQIELGTGAQDERPKGPRDNPGWMGKSNGHAGRHGSVQGPGGGNPLAERPKRPRNDHIRRDAVDTRRERPASAEARFDSLWRT
jgi:hypothetical protein